MKSLFAFAIVSTCLLPHAAYACGSYYEHTRLECQGAPGEILLTGEWRLDTTEDPSIVSTPFQWRGQKLGKFLFAGRELKSAVPDSDSQEKVSDEQWILMRLEEISSHQKPSASGKTAKEEGDVLNVTKFSEVTKHTQTGFSGEEDSNEDFAVSAESEFVLHFDLWARSFALKCRLSNYYSSKE